MKRLAEGPEAYRYLNVDIKYSSAVMRKGGGEDPVYAVIPRHVTGECPERLCKCPLRRDRPALRCARPLQL